MTKTQSDLIYDVGLFNGDDTAYYLYRGYDVVAIDANPVMIDGNVGGDFLGPAAAVVILDFLTPQAKRLVGVPAEYPLSTFRSSVEKSSVRHLGRQAQIRCVKTLKKTDHPLLPEGDLLDAEMKCR